MGWPYTHTCPANVDDYWIDKSRLGKLLDLSGHGGREQQRLPLMTEAIEHIPNLLFKAHIHHSIAQDAKKTSAKNILRHYRASAWLTDESTFRQGHQTR